MEKYIGKSVLKGIAVGRIYWYQKQDYRIVKTPVSDTDAELGRFKQAVETAQVQLSNLYDEAVVNVGEDHAMIFDIHRMMLEDDDYLEAINSEIKDGTNAEYAVEMAQNQFAELFADFCFIPKSDEK